LYGDQMTDVWSGGIVYMYFEEENMFGLASIDGDKATTNEDFDNLSKEIAKATPTGVKADSYTPKNTAAATCPDVNSKWGAPSDPLPPAANAELCGCMMDSVSCTVADSVTDKDLGALIDTVCGLEKGKYCAGINTNTTKGPYGAYGMCAPKEQLAFALDTYYQGQKKAARACDFSASATLKQAATTTASNCQSLMSQAGKEGTGVVAAGAQAGNPSNSKGAAAGISMSHVQVGSIGLGLYVLGAVASGFAMILL
jgi:hypothetical protein